MGDAATLAPGSLRDQTRRTALAALAVAAACTVLFATLWETVDHGQVVHAEERAVADLRHHAVTSVTALAHASSLAGSTQILAGIALTAAAWLLARRRAPDAALVALALAGAQVINAALKNAFERPRPSISDPLDTAAGFSFPSGHAMASMALFATLAFVSTRGRSARTRLAAFGMVAALVGAIGLSRVYLGVHYPTDVAAGWSAGLAWAAITVVLLSLTRVVARARRYPATRTTDAGRRGTTSSLGPTHTRSSRPIGANSTRETALIPGQRGTAQPGPLGRAREGVPSDDER